MFPCCQFQGASVPAIQVGLDAKMPYRSEGSICHLTIHVKPPSIWKERFAGWIQRWSMIWISRQFPLSLHFTASVKSDFFSGRKPYNLHVMFEGFPADTDTPRIMLALHASSVLSTDWEPSVYQLLLWNIKPQELDKVPLWMRSRVGCEELLKNSFRHLRNFIFGIFM